MSRNNGPIALFFLLFLTSATITEAVSVKTWTDSRFLGISKDAALKLLGNPDSPGELDGWKISDSPDFFLAGMLEYTDNKVSSVFAVCQPHVTYQKVKELQVTSPDITVVFDNDKGLLCQYKNPQPGGPIYIAVSPTEDPNTGPMICESNKNPFDVATSDTSKPAEKAAAPAKIDRDEVKNVMMPDIFDWQTLDHDGKIALLKRIKMVWRAYGDETDANAIDAEALLDKLKFYNQAIIFDVACRAAGINPEPYGAMVNEEAK